MPYFFLYLSRFSILIAILLLSSCAQQKLNTTVYRSNNAQQGNTTVILSGNYLDLNQDANAQTLLALNPGRVVSRNNRIYYILNLVYISRSDSLRLAMSDELRITLDQSELALQPYNVQNNPDEMIAFFEIGAFDLVDISNADRVKVTLSTANKNLRASFSVNNRYEFKRFAAKYILNSDYQPAPPKVIAKEKWGFASPGFGSGAELWVGQYSKIILQDKQSLSEYLAINAGFSKFDYEQLGFRKFLVENPDMPGDTILAIRYWQDVQNTKYIPYFGIMYGFSENEWLAPWSVEVGVTVQYFFLPTWQGTVDSIYVAELDTFFPDKKYQITAGELFDGISAGVFIQIGGIWGRINTKKSWAAGISLPVPWW
jgi:hypothetical protein